MEKLFKKHYKVLVTKPDVPEAALQLLKRSDAIEVIILQNVPSVRSDILAKCKGVDGILWVDHQPLNAEILNAAGSKLKAVSIMSAGYDYVDVDEFKKRKLPIGYTPDALTDAVADVGIGLMVAAARRFHEGRKAIESSKWEISNYQWMLGQEIKDSTVGFFGFGNIGQAIANRLKGFKVGQINYHTRNRIPDADKEFDATHVSFDKLLTDSDIIFIASSLTSETSGKFNQAAFSKMKSNCVLVNVARGGIVDQNALYNALKNNKIFAAGLDVMSPEPLPSTDKLLALPNCVVTPHIGSATLRTRTDMATIAVHNVLNGMVGEPMFAPLYQ